MVDGEERDAVASTTKTARLRIRVLAGLGVATAGFAVGAALLGAFDGPDDASAAATAPIVGHVFRSVSVERDGRPMPLFKGTQVWLAIERRSFGANAGCNSLGGPLRVTASRLRVSAIDQTLVGCGPKPERRDDLLSSFFAAGPKWQLRNDRLVLTQGATTMTLKRDDLPPPLRRTNPARAQDLIDASLRSGTYRTWPWRLGGTWGGSFVAVDVTARNGGTFLTMRARCRQLEAPVTIHRATLVVGAPRAEAAPCRSVGSDDFLDSVRPFFGGTVMWHLDRRQLTLQRDRSTLTLRVR